jgi:hypothetical protein
MIESFKVCWMDSLEQVVEEGSALQLLEVIEDG